MENINYKELALNKCLVYEIIKQLNNSPMYRVIDMMTRDVLYYGKNGNKAKKIVKEKQWIN